MASQQAKHSLWLKRWNILYEGQSGVTVLISTTNTPHLSSLQLSRCHPKCDYPRRSVVCVPTKVLLPLKVLNPSYHFQKWPPLLPLPYLHTPPRTIYSQTRYHQQRIYHRYILEMILTSLLSPRSCARRIQCPD